MRLWIGASAVLAAALASARARGQGNDLSAPTGGRSTLMGNTGVALARDGSAPFLNPATIVRIDDRSLAFAVNFYTFASTHFSGWHQPGPVDANTFGNVSLRGTGVSSNTLHILPSSLCLFFTVRGVTSEGTNDNGYHRGRGKLAVCFGSTESDSVSLPALPLHAATSAGGTAQAESIVYQWDRLHVGPTYSISVTDDFAVGASLQGVYTTDSFIIQSSSITSLASGGAAQSSLGATANGHSFDLTGVVGAIYHTGLLTLGANVQVPALHVFGMYDATLTQASADPDGSQGTISTGHGVLHAPPPARFAVGAGLEIGRLALEADETLVVPVGPLSSTMTVTETALAGGGSSTSSRATYVVPQRAVWNTALGFEYFFRPTFSLLGGASTSLTNISSLASSSTIGSIAEARTNDLTASIGIGSYGGGADLLVGVQFGYAWGQSVAVNPYALPNQWVTADMQAYSAMVVFAGATNLRAIGRAVEKIGDAVGGGPVEALGAGVGVTSPRPSAASRGESAGLPTTGPSDPRLLEADGGTRASPAAADIDASSLATSPDAAAPDGGVAALPGAQGGPLPGRPESDAAVVDAAAAPSPALPGPTFDPYNRSIPPR